MFEPLTEKELTALVKEQKSFLSEKELSFFNSIAVPLEKAKIDRSGNIESVFIVAKYCGKIIFYEDVEEGFEITEIDGSGVIKNYGASQFELKHIINQLMNENT